MKNIILIIVAVIVSIDVTGQTFSSELYQSALDGNVSAQFELAVCYHYGYGVQQNRSKALYWAEKAANQGSPAAQYNVGWYYEYGEGVASNPFTAFRWYKKAAECGDPSAEFALARCYYNGIGVAQNIEESIKWTKKAAVDGDADAQVSLGYDYLFGQSVVQDNFLAVYWFRKAAEQENPEGIYLLGECYENGIGVDADLSIALSNYRKAAELGNPSAQLAMAKDAIQKDNYSSAVEWLRKAVEQEYSEAEIILGMCYENGWGLSPSFNEAKHLYERAAEHGAPRGYVQIGRMYSDEESPNYNLPIAYSWYQKAANQDDATAQGVVAWMLLSGQGVIEDIPTGLKWLNLACENGDLWALTIGGMLYFEGIEDVPRDYQKAFKYLLRAFEDEELEEPAKSKVVEYLATCYQKGYGTKIDYSKAKELRTMIGVNDSTKTSSSKRECVKSNSTKAKPKKTLPSWESKMKKGL